jgi:hypothetical protein
MKVISIDDINNGIFSLVLFLSQAVTLRFREMPDMFTTAIGFSKREKSEKCQSSENAGWAAIFI